jgi:energy-coupling factor transporter ATP-binding protein EcfA2
MSDDAVIFERIGVRRMPGFRQAGAGFVIPGLVPGMNIIHGPNGSGKTTTAQAMSLLMWPGLTRAEAASVEGHYRRDGKLWSVDADSGRVTIECDGEKSDPLSFPQVEFRDCYSLALHELIQADNASFAEAIVRESVGGYSIGDAARQLGYQAGPSRLVKEANELKLRKKDLRDSQASQRKLDDQEAGLAGKEKERDLARVAAARAEMLKLAVARLEAAENARDLEAKLSQFPDVMGRLTGQEISDLKSHDGDIVGLESQIETLSRELEDAGERATDAGLPEGGVPEEVMGKIRDLVQRLNSLSVSISAAEQNAARAESARNAEREALGGEIDEEKLSSIDLESIGNLQEFAEEAENIRAGLKACDTVRKWLTPSEDSEDLDRLEEARRLLLRWYRDSGASGQYQAVSRTKIMGIAAGCVLGLLSVVLCFAMHWLWLLLLVFAGAFVVYGIVPPVISNSAEVHRREFVSLDLDQPARWTPQSVQKYVDELGKKIAEVQLQQKRNSLWHDRYESEEKTLVKSSDDLDKRRRELAAVLGAEPGPGEARLIWFVQTLRRWKSAAAQMDSVGGEIDLLKKQLADLLSGLNDELVKYGYEPADDVSGAVGLAGALEIKNRNYLVACDAIKASNDRRDDLLVSLKKLRDKRCSLFSQFELADGDEAGLHALCRRQEDYVDAVKRNDEARTVLKLALERLSGHSTFDEGIMEMDGGELGRMLEEAELDANEYDGLNTEIIGVNTSLKDVRKSHDIERALGAVEECLGRISDRRDGDRASAVGHVLAACLEKHRREAEMPVVFERARELFTKITHGTYRLEMAESGDSAFRAFDMVQGKGCELDELSSGTRVQLLLSVRLAFMESREAGVRPPLIIDEALANSDDPRADTIIHSIIDVCKTGRQIFYFTAQADEVGKWMRALEGQGEVPYSVVDLAKVRNLSETSVEIPVPALDVSPVPPPGDMTYDQYSDALGVPPIDRRKGVDSVHIWHVLDDTAVLHELLASGVSRWGQVRSFIDHGGGALFEAAPQQLARAVALSKAIEIMCAMWRTGRGRPVDSVALAESEAVSDKFMDGMCELAESVGGDADALLAALRDHRLARFRDQNTERLSEYLEREGYMDQDEVLSPGEIRRRVMAGMSAEITGGVIERKDLDRLFAAQ